MFASFILAASVLASVPDSDQLGCPGSPRAPAPAQTVSLWFEPQLPWFVLNASPKAQTTTLADGLSIRFHDAQWFQSYAGAAGNGTWAIYDTVSHAYYACGHHDTAVQFDAFEVPVGWIARAVPAVAAHLGFRTEHGVAFGSSREDVQRLYGRETSHTSAINALAYTKRDRVGSSWWNVTTTFYFDGDRLIGIDRIVGM